MFNNIIYYPDLVLKNNKKYDVYNDPVVKFLLFLVFILVIIAIIEMQKYKFIDAGLYEKYDDEYYDVQIKKLRDKADEMEIYQDNLKYLKPSTSYVGSRKKKYIEGFDEHGYEPEGFSDEKPHHVEIPKEAIPFNAVGY
jgi:hypothetical protein